MYKHAHCVIDVVLLVDYCYVVIDFMFKYR